MSSSGCRPAHRAPTTPMRRDRHSGAVTCLTLGRSACDVGDSVTPGALPRSLECRRRRSASRSGCPAGAPITIVVARSGDETSSRLHTSPLACYGVELRSVQPCWILGFSGTVQGQCGSCWRCPRGGLSTVASSSRISFAAVCSMRRLGPRPCLRRKPKQPEPVTRSPHSGGCEAGASLIGSTVVISASRSEAPLGAGPRGRRVSERLLLILRSL